MAADLIALKKGYLFFARMKCGEAGYAAQKDLLSGLFLKEAGESVGGDVEMTASSFEGQTSSMQYRGATGEERREALRLAIEELEALIAEEVAKAEAPRAFAVRFVGGSPFAALNG